MKTKSIKKTETFRVKSREVVFGDPCYDTNEFRKAKNGDWVGHVVMTDESGWGRRVKKVIVHHVDFNPAEPGIRTETVGFSVDSGQAGVFDVSEYGSEGFYDMCCACTLSKRQYGYLGHGFVTSSGLGDGWYEAEVMKIGGETVCLELTFME